ncbi:MAG TPA: fused response regulator/phosphatase [Pirellulales bacterium]|nr:fused response regulator/phosphatase [Pirellulales bacterium]
MRVLVGWDDADEIDLLSMYLEAGENEVTLVRDPEALVAALRVGDFDVVLVPVTFPDGDRSFAAVEAMRDISPDTPVIVAARPGEIYALSRFISHGVDAHVYRDPAKEYLFLMQAILESALAAKRAAQARLLTEKLRSEIDSVRKLQESMIPRDMSAPPGYEIVARYEPSQIQVSGGKPVVLAGGDYYYAFQLAGEKLVFLVGDASGHGIKACMAIMSMHTLIDQLQGHLNGTPDEFVSQVNRRLCGQQLVQDQGGFITLIYGVLQGGILRWTSAGHCLPLLQNLDTGEIVEVGDPEHDGGLPLAVYEDAEYATVTSEIPAACRLMIYTDGIVEAMPGGGEHRQFGLAGVKQTLERCRALPLTATLDALFEDSQAFTAGGGRHDDTSVLLLERHRTSS